VLCLQISLPYSTITSCCGLRWTRTISSKLWLLCIWTLGNNAPHRMLAHTSSWSSSHIAGSQWGSLALHLLRAHHLWELMGEWFRCFQPILAELEEVHQLCWHAYLHLGAPATTTFVHLHFEYLHIMPHNAGVISRYNNWCFAAWCYQVCCRSILLFMNSSLIADNQIVAQTRPRLQSSFMSDSFVITHYLT